MTPRSVTLAVLAIVIVPNVAHALSSDFYGRWTDHKGKCKDEEHIYTITNKSFSRYESSCKIVKEENHDPLKLGLPHPKLTLSCSSEGDISKDVVYLDDLIDGMLKIQYQSDGDGFRRLYKCKK